MVRPGEPPDAGLESGTPHGGVPTPPQSPAGTCGGAGGGEVQSAPQSLQPWVSPLLCDRSRSPQRWASLSPAAGERPLSSGCPLSSLLWLGSLSSGYPFSSVMSLGSVSQKVSTLLSSGCPLSPATGLAPLSHDCPLSSVVGEEPLHHGCPLSSEMSEEPFDTGCSLSSVMVLGP